jgi:hypothetical protein
MRKTKLLTATALSLILSGVAVGVFAGQANADTTVSSSVTTPYLTSQAGNLTVASGGTITLTSGTAITVDSNNTVDLEGKIAMSGSDAGSTGILITGGRTSGLTVNGTITVTDNFTATDTSSPTDGIADGPFADSGQRYGIHSTGTTPFVGNVTIGSGAAIDVEGGRAPNAGSYGIRFENNITGNFASRATTTVIGDNATGISLEGGVTGTTYIGGSMSVLGQNATAVNLGGNYGDNVVIGGAYTNTGYATTAAQTTAETAILLANPNDTEQAGSLMTLSGNFAHGILFEAPPTTNSSLSSTDQDGDGITDSTESTASLTQYGSAPALLVGNANANQTIGGTVTVVGTTGAATAPSINYGLWNRGSITASGVYAGRSANAIQIGGLGHAVTIANGIGNNGTISASALAANATGLHFASGASTPQLDINAGTISATGSDVVTTNTSVTPNTYSVAPGSANAIVIDAGASLPTINVTGTSASITATGVGSQSSATAILDKSNTLTAINNQNTITASITATDENGTGVASTVINRPVAIDAHTNTVGMTITQTAISTTSNGTTTTNTPSISGDILLGSGNNTINLNAGTITGNIDFGAGASQFNMSGASTAFVGKLTSAGTVGINFSAGTAIIDSGTKLNVSTFHLGSTAVLGLQLDTKTPSQAMFNVAGNAVFDNGAKLGINLNDILLAPTTFKVMTASNISLGNLALSDLSSNTPYLYAVALVPNSTNTELDATFRIKTQAEGGFNSNEYNAMTPVLTAISQDSGATTALLSETTRKGFESVYNQYLPDFSGENLLTLSHGAESVTQSLGTLTLIPDNMAGQYWATENGFETHRPYRDTNGFKATGFAFAGGREQAIGGRQMLGVYLSYTSTTPVDTFAIGAENLVNSDLTVGGYWRLRDEGFKAWANAGAGYADFKSTRVVVNADENHTATSTWGGFSYSAGLGASYQYRLGSFSLTPQVMGDLYGLNEARHTEQGGTNYFDLAVGKRNGRIATGQALVNFSYDKWFVRPELWVGYKDNLSVDIANTTAAFTAAGSTPFTLTGGNVKGGGPVAGFRFSADNAYSYFSLEGDYEDMPNYTNFSIALRTRFQF